MKYLLDTHALLWWWIEPMQLSDTVKQVIYNPHNQIFVSPINLWELAIKYQKGKLPQARTAIDEFETLIQEDSFELLPIKLTHTRTAALYNQPHSDPFDRILVAQAQCEQLILISKDSKLPQFGIQILW